MRSPAAVPLLLSVVLSAQAPALDGGRLDPAWFGAGATFQPSKALGFLWMKPGLDLRGRGLRLEAWQAPAWLLGSRDRKDQAFVARVEGSLPTALERGLRRGLKGSLPVSASTGDLRLVARIVDAIGLADDYMAVGRVSLSIDLKLLDGTTGELLGAFHDTLESPSADDVTARFEQWSREVGRSLAPAAAGPVAGSPAGPEVPAPAPIPAPPMASPVPPAAAFDLEVALARIEGLKRDGLLSEEEYQALRRKAMAKAR